jgi:hypothetical protein
MAKPMVKQKVMGKQRRSKEYRFVEKVETYSIFKPRQFPLSLLAKFKIRWCLKSDFLGT